MVPDSSPPGAHARLAFANDGTLAWLRRAGGTLVAIDPRTGVVLRELRLDPIPFGLGWRVERRGTYFVVRDDHELAAYDDVTGVRLWKRSSLTRAAFVGERAGRHVSVIPGPHGDGIDVALADLATGDIESKLRVDGTLHLIGAHGTVAGDRLFFATDERDVLAVDLERWEVVERHRLPGSHALPPIITAAGVHVASIERREAGAVTHVARLDPVTGARLSTHELPGAAHLLSVGTSGAVVLETRRRQDLPVERISYRPDAPHLRLTVTKHVDLRLTRNDVARLEPVRLLGAARGHGADVRVHPAPTSNEAHGRHDELRPAPRDGQAGNEGGPRAEAGLLGLLALLDADSDVVTRLAEASGTGTASARLERLGVTLRDPRARWSTGAGRDPCLLDLAENREGDAIATYHYPARPSSRVPVVLVSCVTGEARWLADDLDVWFAGVLHNAAAYAPEAVHGVLRELGLPGDFPRPLGTALPPPWFFEAHATAWTVADADAALAAGDLEGAERMLVAVGRGAAATAGRGARADAVAKDRLASVYAMLGWDHHRATVVETW